tara:strand:- start:35615 stop:35746 length:132 start_codon:yes stop_codon:yes gene_type:complete
MSWQVAIIQIVMDSVDDYTDQWLKGQIMWISTRFAFTIGFYSL